MISQLLWIEFLVKLAAGLALAIAPRATITALGLPAAGATAVASFWPRLSGVLLVGIAGASFLQGWLGRANGLGLAGSAFINVCLAGMIFATLASGRNGMPRRGRILFWLLGLVLLTTGVIEIAFAEGSRPA